MKLDLRSARSGVLCMLLVLTSTGCVKTDNKVDPAPPPVVVTLSSVSVTPAGAAVGIGGTQQYSATGTYSDSTTQDLTQSVSWSTDNAAIATINNTANDEHYGVLTAVGLGSANVSATYTPPATTTTTETAVPVVGTTLVTVVNATVQSLTLTIGSTRGTAPVGFVTQLAATGNYTDGTHSDLTTSVSWMGLTPDIATLSDAAGTKGALTGVKAGSAKVRAILNDITQDGTVIVANDTLVNIAMTPPSVNLPANTTQQFSCKGNFSDGEVIDLTQQTDWASSDTSIVTVSNDPTSKGFATGQAGLFPGSANVTATYGTVVGTSKVTRPLF
jgi:hypothetical protein